MLSNEWESIWQNNRLLKNVMAIFTLFFYSFAQWRRWPLETLLTSTTSVPYSIVSLDFSNSPAPKHTNILIRNEKLIGLNKMSFVFFFSLALFEFYFYAAVAAAVIMKMYIFGPPHCVVFYNIHHEQIEQKHNAYPFFPITIHPKLLIENKCMA